MPASPAKRQQSLTGEQQRREEYRLALRLMFANAGASLAEMQAKGLDPDRMLRRAELASIACGPVIAAEVFAVTKEAWEGTEKTNVWTGEPIYL